MPLSRFQPTFLQPPPMTAPPRLGQLPVSTASPAGSAIQGLLQGYMAGQKQKAAEKSAGLEEKRLAIAQAQAMVKTVGQIDALPQAVKKAVAPALLAPFIDTKSEQGKALIAAMTVTDPDAGQWVFSVLRKTFSNAEFVDKLQKDPEFRKTVRNKPLDVVKSFLEVAELEDDRAKQKKLDDLFNQYMSGNQPPGQASGEATSSIPQAAGNNKLNVLRRIAVASPKSANAIARVEGLDPELTAAKQRAKLEATERYKRSKPIPPAMARLTGLPVGTKVGEAKDQGYSVPDDKAIRTLTQKRAFTNFTKKSIAGLQDIIRKNPESYGTSGAFANAVSGFFAQAKNFAKLADIPVEASLNPENYKETFREIGIENTKVQSRIMQLAFGAAAAEGQTGRAISDQDVTRFIRIIGANTNDAAAFVENLNDFSTRLENSLTQAINGEFGIAPVPMIERIETMSLPDILKLNPDDLTQAEAAAAVRRYDLLNKGR